MNEAVREYLHANGVAVLEYEQVWKRLESFGELVKAERGRKAGDSAKSSNGDDKLQGSTKEKQKEPGEKVVKTDKVLAGKKTSWAVAEALGEVSR